MTEKTSKPQGARDRETQYPRLPFSRFNKLINLTMSRLFELHNLNITREQEVILRELSQIDGLNQVDLANRVGQDKDNLSRTLSLLENKNCVRRSACSEDRRKMLIYITEDGQKLHREAYKVIEKYRRILFRNFQKNEIDQFSRGLYRLIDNLADFLEQDKTENKPAPASQAKRAPSSAAKKRRAQEKA